MTIFDRIIPVAFLACVALTACNQDSPVRDGFATSVPTAFVEPLAQPTVVPAPAASPAPAVADTAKATPSDQPSIKKSSLMAPKSPKVIWV